MQPVDPTALTSIPEASRLRAGARACRDLLAMAGGILYWGVVGLTVTLVCAPLYLLLPKRTGSRLGRRLLHGLFRSFVAYLRATRLVRVDSTALDILAAETKPLILAPNHASLWDAVFIIARLPRTICVMKRAILHNPFLGGGAKLAGYIPNGTTTRMLREAVETVRAGGQLLLFPEGTRTRPDQRWINPIKGGCAIVACRSGATVYPIFIRSNTRFLQKGWPLWRPPVFPIELCYEVGPPLRPEPNESPQAFTRRLQSTYERELAKPHPLRRQIAVPEAHGAGAC